MTHRYIRLQSAGRLTIARLEARTAPNAQAHDAPGAAPDALAAKRASVWTAL
ncbi:MAG: hypothetical protein NDI74_11455 [Sphingomonas sp.]|mgnify:FL=1|jgi:hypothetical protein|uniref:hypothetical protein n=1 Tax=Sphingomonas TaxID=13687 RepID=UPI00036579F2|nr:MULTISPECIES: hypothetical protein [Sphingomonas]MBX8845620.1 hypothetical protein [Sphingomonas melonis]MBX8854709.1 hypothetical protein [Sphingomonas melonis]MBX8899688.1 hypothetical protein [Sphingomonas melonis]MCM2300025.1 hypothetical protein [Sphingomonas sp.]